MPKAKGAGPAADVAAPAAADAAAPAAADAVMEIDAWTVAYGAKQVLNEVSFDVTRPEVLALIGPSGCGKTTLLRSLNRLLELAPTARHEGAIRLDGEDVYGTAMDANLLRRRVGMVFQQPNPFPMSIFENVAFALREQARRRPRRSALEEPVEEALRRAGLWDEVRDSLGRSALSLSGGQQQRLCIARSLAARPEVLLMDEPCSALDPRSTARIEELIRALRGDVTVVIVTHDMQQARRVSDQTAFFLNGDLVERGPTEQPFTAPEREETRDYVSGVFG